MVPSRPHRPRWPLATWLLVSHLAVGIAAVAILLLTGLLDRDLRWQTREALRGQAHVWALALAAEAEASGDPLAAVAARAQPRLAAARERTLVGLQVVDAEARVVASARPSTDASLADAPEVIEALHGGVGEYIRPRPDAGTRSAIPAVAWSGHSRQADVRLFVAVPIVVEDAVVGAIVVSRTPRAQLQAWLQLGSPLGWRLLSISAVACLVALGAGRLGGRSLRRLARGATRIARGERSDAGMRRVGRSRVAEVAAVADAVAEMGQRLRTRVDGAEAFAGHAAHELRTPIATLRGTLELLQDDPDMPAAQRDRFLRNGAIELDRLDALVGALLDLGRGQRRAIADDPVDLDAVVTEAAGAFDVPVRGHATIVTGSAASLRVVLDNLLSNARRHGGPNVWVTAFCERTHTGFCVHDDGPPLAPQVRARLFERFFSTDSRRGVGLGLAVVRSLVSAHAGRVEVECDGTGTSFRVVLPRRDARRASDHSAATISSDFAHRALASSSS